MNAYANDDEQVEVLKRWWKNYGKTLTIAIVIGLVIGFGYRYWRGQQEAHKERASTIYQAMTVAMVNKQPKQAKSFANGLIKDYASTPYAAYTQMTLAKQSVEKNNLTDANARLQWVIDHSKVISVKQIARIRAARVLIAMKKPQASLKLLATVDDKAYTPLIDNVKGDAYMALGQKQKALILFNKAKVGLNAIGSQAPIISMKLAAPPNQS